jgi:predicted nucleic acid-binding protein
MTFDQIPSGAEVFLDANALIYHFVGDPTYGAACTRLVERIEQLNLRGFTSAGVVSDAAHRIMTIEAMQKFGWPTKGLAARLQRLHAEIAKLTLFQQAIEQIPRLGIELWDVRYDSVATATILSRQYELLSGDAQIVSVMQARGLTNLASHDSDFDRVPWIVRYTSA